MRMILSFYEVTRAADPTVTGDDLVLWRKDLKGAYNLISFRTEDVRCMATELIDENNPDETLIMVLFCGIFGWSGTPGAFHVVTRAIVPELRESVLGKVDMYLDDVIGITLRKYLRTTWLWRAVVADKDKDGRRLDVIGYTIDLYLQRLTIAHKNIQSTIHGYFSVDLEKPVSVKELERLASWGSRYKSICGHLRPFNKELYDAYAGRWPGVHVTRGRGGRSASGARSSWRWHSTRRDLLGRSNPLRCAWRGSWWRRMPLCGAPAVLARTVPNGVWGVRRRLSHRWSSGMIRCSKIWQSYRHDSWHPHHTQAGNPRL